MRDIQRNGITTKKPAISARLSAQLKSKPDVSSVWSNTRSSARTTHIKQRRNFPCLTCNAATASFVHLQRVQITLR